jgi:ATP/maltotriose-dependent transcriptional regulator MalT/DNA-binding SARP family transcriptional activator
MVKRTSYVARDRLVDRLLASRLGVIEAGAGFGKSVLASQYREALGVATMYVPLGAPDSQPELLVASLRRAMRSARLTDLLAATEAPDPSVSVERLLDALADAEAGVLIILDDAHHLLSSEAAAVVLRLARGLPSPHRLLIAARSLTSGLEPLRGIRDAALLDTGALAFTTDEAAQLVRTRRGFDIPEPELRVWVESTQGWATALVLAASAHGVRGRSPGGSPTGDHDLIGAPLHGLLEAMAPRERRTVIQLAHLPMLSAELADAVAGAQGTFERLVAAGVPLARTDSGWWELPSPVATHLMTHAPVEPATAIHAANVYGRHDDVLGAVRVLLAAERLAAVSPPRAEDLGLSVMRDLVETCGAEAANAHPEILLHLARVAEIAHQADLRAEALERVTALPTARLGAALRREVDAERARDLMWDERTRDEARRLAEGVIADAGDGEIVARARTLDLLGRLACGWFSGCGPQPDAELRLAESARLARRIGHGTWAAQALIPLAMGFYFALCHYDHALAVLDEALSDLGPRNRYRAMVLAFRAEVLVEMGRFAEAGAALGEVHAVGEWSREEWILAYAAWGEANLASYTGDAERTLRAVREVDRHLDAWYEQPSGVEWLAQAADFLDRVGEHEPAQRALRQARERQEGAEHPVRIYGALVTARSGDPAEAERLIAELLTGEAIEPQERWPLLLLRAYAAQRRRDPHAGRMAAAAFEACGELGHPEGPLRRERVVANALLPLAAQSGSRTAAALVDQDRSQPIAIQLLGAFELLRGGRVVPLPPGRPAKAVRAVAAAGGRLQADELIELLWPDTEVLVGRNRLRNLLSRLRLASGKVLIRTGQMIELPPGREIDAEQFESQARAALSAHASDDERRAAVLARLALDRYSGELLPADRYEGWAAAPRERMERLYVEILDLLAGLAERDGDYDETVRLIRRAVEREPFDELRYLRLARLLASQGRAGSALAALRQARSALADLGLEASFELEQLERRIGPGYGHRAPPPSV